MKHGYKRFVSMVLAVMTACLWCVAQEVPQEQLKQARKLRAEGGYLELKGKVQEAVAAYEKSLALHPDPVLNEKVKQLKQSLSSEKAAPTATQVDLGQVASHLDVRAETFIYCNAETMVKRVREHLGQFADILQSMDKPEATNAGAVLTMADQVLDWAGLYSMQAYGFSLAPVDGTSYRIKMFAARSSADSDKLVYQLLGGEPRALKSLPYAVDDTALLLVSNTDFVQFWNQIKQGVTQFGGPQAADMLQSRLQSMQQHGQIDAEDLLSSLGNEFFLSLQLSKTTKVTLPMGQQTLEVPQPSFLLGVQLKSDMLLKTMLGKLQEAKLPVVQQTEGDVVLHSVNLPIPLPVPVQPTLAYQDGMLLIGSTPDAVTAAMAARAEKKGLTADATFKKLFHGMPDKVNGIYYVSPRVAEFILDLQKKALAMAPKDDPEVTALTKWMGQLTANRKSVHAAMYRINQPDGIYAESTLAFGGEHPAIAFSTAPLGIMAAVAIPAMVKARDHARDIRCMNNLHQIDMAKQTWALKENKEDGSPVTWEDLKYMAESNLRCPKGGEYKLNPLGENPTCSVHGDLLDQ